MKTAQDSNTITIKQIVRFQERMHLEKFQFDKIQNSRLSTIIHHDRPHIAENLSVFTYDRKRGYRGHLDFISFYKSFLFSVKCLETWYIPVYVFGVRESIGIVHSASLLGLSVFTYDRKRGYRGHLDFINFYKSFLFSVKCLETWYIPVYVFGVRESIGIVHFHVRPKMKLWRPYSVK